MSRAHEAGVIRIAAEVAGGQVIASTVRSDRPLGLTAALARHPAPAIPALARRLFALCGTSHEIAAAQALAVAGANVAAPPAEVAIRALAAERIAAHLQATFIVWSNAVPLTSVELAALSGVLGIVKRAQVDGDALLAGLAVLGLSDRTRAGSWAERLLAVVSDGNSACQVADTLTDADDERVAAALDAHGDAFAAAPLLPGRRPETGPAARAARRGWPMASAAERLWARLEEIAAAARIAAGLQRAEPAAWISTRRHGATAGICAIETPRGRLYHLARLGADGAVARHHILAPTEWNFAVDGPFRATLDGLRVSEGREREMIARLASLYDPCVGCEVEVRRRDGRPGRAGAEPALNPSATDFESSPCDGGRHVAPAG